MVKGVPRNLLDKDGPDYAESTMRFLHSLHESVEASHEHWVKVLEEAQQAHVEQNFPRDNPYGDFEALLREEFGLSLEDAQNKKAWEKRQDHYQKKGLREGPGNPTGVNQTTEGNYNNYNNSGDGTPKQGTSQDYLLARLRRDHPAILSRLEAGEFRSVRAAAIEAGIVKDEKRVSVPVGDMKRAARLLKKHFGEGFSEFTEEVVKLNQEAP